MLLTIRGMTSVNLRLNRFTIRQSSYFLDGSRDAIRIPTCKEMLIEKGFHQSGRDLIVGADGFDGGVDNDGALFDLKLIEVIHRLDIPGCSGQFLASDLLDQTGAFGRWRLRVYSNFSLGISCLNGRTQTL